MPVQWRNRDIAASLEYVDEFGGGFNVFRPVVNVFQRLLGIGPPVEESWQKELRHYDLNHVGILGNSLDIISFTAAACQLNFVDPMDYQIIPNQILQEKILVPCWRGDKDIFEMLFVGVRALASVGEFDLVCINGEYDIFQVSQRVKTDKKNDTIIYRQRDSVSDDLVEVPRSQIERCFFPQPGANHEATAPARRVLPALRLYAQIMTQFQRIAFSNSLMTKLVYFGEDDGDWLRDEAYMSQFSDPTKATPPVVNDATNTAKAQANGESIAPFMPMMGVTAPLAVDLTTSFDLQAREMLKQCNNEIALGLNIPAKVLLGEDVTHFVEWSQNEQFRTFAVAPLLKIMLKFLDKHIYGKFATKYGYSAKLWYSFDELSGTSLNPAQFIELFKIGVIGSAGIQRHLRLSAADSILSPEDIQRRRELLTGDSGLQQAQLAQKYAQQQGQQKQAVPDSNPLTNGNMRQGNENKATPPQIAAALAPVKKKTSMN